MFYDNFNIKSEILNFKEDMIKTKKYWIIYILLVSIFTISNLTIDNLTKPKMEILMFLLVLIIGIFLIIFFERHKTDKNYIRGNIISREYINNSFSTIQSSLDLIKDSNMDNSTVFNINTEDIAPTKKNI